MAIIPGSIYAAPGVYTRTLFEDPLQGLASSVRLPLLMGTGSEILFQDSLELVRGSSSSVDQRVVQEDETGRGVVSISLAGAVTLGAFDDPLQFEPRAEIFANYKLKWLSDNGCIKESFEEGAVAERIQLLMENLEQRG